ncbi:ABC transporter permease [Glycomyces sp. NPDC021274]|uniref:ABC transporter permease n=1 Tax=Glycomyces sp. NPDC021274 TaxID=3155120 RepID=UPI0033FCC232
MSSGSAAFASPPPSAAPGITPGHQGNAAGSPPRPHAPQPPQGYGPAYAAPAGQPQAYGAPTHHQAPPPPNPGYGAPQGQQPYGTPPPPHGPGQGQGQQPYGAPQPHGPGQPGQPQGQPNPYGQPQGQPQGQPNQGGSGHFQPQQPPPPPATAPAPHGQSSPPRPTAPAPHTQTPPPPASAPQNQGQQPGQQANQQQAGQQNPAGQVPQAPYATRNEPSRDMPVAGASPIRRNLDDTAELPAFLDSARSDETGPITRPAEVKPLKRKFPLTTGFTALVRHRNALSVLVRRDLAVKYQGTVMGYIWSLIEPLGLTVIYWFVFDLVFGGGNAMPENANGERAGYLLFIVSGIFAYQWFSSGVNEGAKSLGGQAALITVMKVPREVFPVSKVFARFAEYVVGFPILIAVAIWQGGTFGLNLLWLFPAILVQTMLLAGMVFILAGLNVLYKDVSRFLPLIMRVLFYASAIIYPVTKVSEAPTMEENPWLYDIFSSNPLIGIFSMHRAAFIPELAPTTFQLCVAVGVSVFLMFFGRWIFYRVEPRVLKAL